MVKEQPILALDKVSHWFQQGEKRILIAQRVDLVVRRGEQVALMGRSGAGKSTLLHIACLLEHPREGEVVIDGRVVSSLSDGLRSKIRGQRLGFVYQYYHLLNDFSAQENVMLPCLLQGASSRQARVRATAMLEDMGLGDRLRHRPGALSGGEQQRVAIARAMINQPDVLLADEPTGNLDATTGKDVLDVLLRLSARDGMALLIATHDRRVAERLGRIAVLHEGALNAEGETKKSQRE